MTICCENDIEKKLSELFKDVKVVGYRPVHFFCGCSKEMFYGMLHSLSKSELKQAIHNKEAIDTACQICGRTYRFDYKDISLRL